MSQPAKTFVTSVALDGGCVDAAGMATLAARVEAAAINIIVLGAATPGLDPFVVAGWLAPRLSHAGLVVTLPTLHTEPFHAARALSALDILTGGRAGWAPATLGHAEQARRIGSAALTDDSKVFPKALDFIAATCALWDSWDADALILDKESGIYLDSSQVRRANYRGPYFQAVGPLNAARPLQGYPVLVQSDDDSLWPLTADRTDVLLVTAPDADILSARRADIVRSGGHAAILAEIDIRAEGSVTEVVDQISAWFASGLIDGVHSALAGAEALEEFTDVFIPQLRARTGAAPATMGGDLRTRLAASHTTKAARP